MSRAFLSHNGFDKDFVEAVFDRLGNLQAIYDKKTFEKNSDLAFQIRNGLEDSELYVLFLSQAALSSGWVSNELDLANELKTKWQIRKFLIFQLDDTSWSKLPSWANRYVVSCPPSPEIVALRIKDELRKGNTSRIEAYGRGNDTRRIHELLLDLDQPPAFLALTGATGIGRRTLADEVYHTFYQGVANSKISINLSALDDDLVLYKRLLEYSANWRARDYQAAVEDYVGLSGADKVIKLSDLIKNITVGFNQVLILDVGSNVFGADHKLLNWFSTLLSVLESDGYPYVVVLINGGKVESSWTNGLVYAVQPLSEEDSRYLFKMLLHKNKIAIPDRREKSYLENSIIGHAGLIAGVVSYLKANSSYRPNRTHAAVMQLVRVEVERMVADFVSHKPELNKVIELLGEASVLSYPEVIKLNEEWSDFCECVDQLMDVGFLLEENGNYYLAPYLQRYAQNYHDKTWQGLPTARRILFETIEGVDDDSYIPIELLDARMVEYLVSDTDLPSYLSNLIMPVQLLKAAKRHYDSRNYPKALSLALEAYEQDRKLSISGKTEAWRLIGLSACRVSDAEASEKFRTEYQKIPKSDRRDATFYFVQGFAERLKGNLRNALPLFEKIIDLDVKDGHADRELAYIYAFEGRFDLANQFIERAKQTVRVSPYVIDVEAYVLLEKYRIKKDALLIREIDDCLERLEEADLREGRRFAPVRKSMRDILIDDRYETLRTVFNERSQLSIHPKVALLDLLSMKGKNDQYSTLLSEIHSALKSTKNRLAEVEVAKIEIGHLAYNGRVPEAKEKLARWSHKLTEASVSLLNRTIDSSEAYGGRLSK
ncbi:TIR domain-containing protein [Pseudomonas aeruginosa]